jgi:DNA polymerase (family 10)
MTILVSQVESEERPSKLEMAEKARSLGYSYLAVTDHSQSLKIARGLDRRALASKKREIDRLNAGYRGFRILFGTEADIDLEGSIDYPDDVLREFDLVVAAVHTGFKQTKAQMTKRIVAACRNPYVNVIAHPTGRLWGEREGYDADFGEIIKAAADTNTALEINAFPNRLDLNDQYVYQARSRGCRVSIDTDSHAAAHLDNMRLGVFVARRGWLEAKDVINTLSLEKLLPSVRKQGRK